MSKWGLMKSDAKLNDWDIVTIQMETLYSSSCNDEIKGIKRQENLQYVEATQTLSC